MPANLDFEKEVQNLSARVVDLEQRCARMREAFVKNDLGAEDYDGHRRAHAKQIDEDKIVSGYKRGVTQNAIWAAIAGLAALIGYGLLDWLRTHIK